MADGHVHGSSNTSVNNHTASWDSNIINESIKSESITYDGTRVKWCKDYESLKIFIEAAFGLDGKWRSFGESSKKFDAANADFSTIWYPGKLNTLTFNGKIGKQAKENLINRCELSSMSDVENTVNQTTSKCTQLEGKSIEMQIQNDDQNDERCSNNEYHTKPQDKARSVPVANPDKVRSRKKKQQQPDRPKSQQAENLHTKSSNWLNYLPLFEVPSRKQSEEIENKKGKINKENFPSRPGNNCSYTDYHFPTRNYYPPFRKHRGSWHSTHPPSYQDRREDWLNYLVFVRQALRT
ncbi:Hypothetical predicted protein [Paramuricea clavata]|uniref:Uncharacterized protein n=1 Tax=Paramuricea clavata TaxID=317549 RepID=A0A6S7G9J5_PARCT|nr:Hypothetical predicted protein [Paramuricea clavata]